MSDPADRIRYRRVLTAVAGVPWALAPERLSMICEVLAMRAGGEKLSAEEIAILCEQRAPRAGYLAAAADGPARASTARGVLVVPVAGILSHRVELMNEMSGPGGTSTERLGQRLRHAAADPNVGGVLLEVDSPGGSVAGIPELAADIRRLADAKPVHASINTDGLSAAYWLASQAHRVAVTPSGSVGAIGVYTAHADLSRQLDSRGITMTLVAAGEYKTEGSPYAPLSDAAREHMQTRVDETYRDFLAAVATGRGAPVDTVAEKYGQGRAYGAREALERGMVDAVEPFDATLDALLDDVAGGASTGTARTAGPTALEEISALVPRDVSDLIATPREPRVPRDAREFDFWDPAGPRE